MPASLPAELPEPDGPTLTAYLGWLRRRWWILIVLALAGAGSALMVTQLQPRAYTSSTTLLVRLTAPDANPTAKVNLDTEAEVVRSLVVAERARKLMGASEPADQLVRQVRVTVPPNSQVLQIAYEAATPQRAQSGSHGFAQAYLDLKLDDANRRLENEVTALRAQITEVQKRLTVVTGQLAAAAPGSVARQRAESDLDVLTAQLTGLNNRLSPLTAQVGSVDAGEIISDARLPVRPSSPNRTLNLASGLGAGLLFGIVLALALDRLDTRVRRGRDISDRLGLPVLLEVTDRPQSLSLLPATHRISRELGRLRNVLLTTVPEARTRGNGRQLLVTDASDGPAAGFVVGNLAAAYARTGQQVAVVTTKPESPLTRMLGRVEPRHTLSEVLRRDVTALKALTPVPGLTQLRVLLPGQLDAEVELPVAAMLEVLGELAARFDHVLVETASPTLAVEAQALASHVDAVLVVAEAGRTRSGEIAAALRQFEQVDAPVLGAVLVPKIPAQGGRSRRAEAPAAGRGRGAEPDAPTPARPAAPRDRKAMMILPQPAESTVVLPRVKSPKPDSSLPSTGTGQAPGAPITYRSGQAGEPGTGRASIALDKGEGAG